MAGKWLFKDQPFQIIRNAIEAEMFKFNPEARRQIRQKYNIKNNFLIGHVGRFDTQKNHMFLLDVFAEIYKTIPKSKLILIGEGHLKEAIQQKISTLNLEEHVILTGVRDDVNLFYNAFDLFVLPSLFEGLPVVAIENQANGCPTFLSSEITREAQISTNIDFIDLKKELWYKKIIEYIETHKTPRTDFHFDIQASGYDIKTEAQKLQEIYIDLWNKN